MPFCEECGTELSSGLAFCENCGAKVEVTREDYSNKSKDSFETGIIYTNLTLLAEKQNKSVSELRSIIDSFINDAKNRNAGAVNYSIVDVSKDFSGCGSINAHISLLKSLAATNPIKYLFIIGSEDVIPSITWENDASDKSIDYDVASDLPFSTLDINSPFMGQEYDFSKTLRIGRLLNVDIEHYFKNVCSCEEISYNQTFALSAKVWTKETIDNYKKIQNGPGVFSSPNYALSNILEIISPETNMFLFNLHGSRQTKYWYGQEGSLYPEAIEPTTFDLINNPYFLAVEACYGAVYVNRAINESVVLSALSGKCVSFLGASRIAFGASIPPGSCADVICGEFLQNLQKGYSAGDSLELARAVLMEKSNATTIKTLAEFSLYGDPSVRMNNNRSTEKTFSPFNDNENSCSKAVFEPSKKERFSFGISVPLPNIRRAVKLELANVDDKISKTITEAIYAQYEDLKGVEPTFYKNTNQIDENVAVFAKDTLIGKKIVSVNFERTGTIKQIYESK